MSEEIPRRAGPKSFHDYNKPLVKPQNNYMQTVMALTAAHLETEDHEVMRKTNKMMRAAIESREAAIDTLTLEGSSVVCHRLLLNEYDRKNKLLKRIIFKKVQADVNRVDGTYCLWVRNIIFMPASEWVIKHPSFMNGFIDTCIVFEERDVSATSITSLTLNAYASSYGVKRFCDFLPNLTKVVIGGLSMHDQHEIIKYVNKRPLITSLGVDVMEDVDHEEYTPEDEMRYLRRFMPPKHINDFSVHLVAQTRGESRPLQSHLFSRVCLNGDLKILRVTTQPGLSMNYNLYFIHMRSRLLEEFECDHFVDTTLILLPCCDQKTFFPSLRRVKLNNITPRYWLSWGIFFCDVVDLSMDLKREQGDKPITEDQLQTVISKLTRLNPKIKITRDKVEIYTEAENKEE